MVQRPIVHLFIGLHKTGSTAIRFMLDVHRDLLPKYGFYLPLATWTRYIKHSWNGGHNNIAWELFKQRPIPAWGSIADLVNEIHEHPARQHILLTEDLDTAAEAHIEALGQSLSGCDVRIIIFVRNQVDWIQSSSGEDQKWFGAPSFDNWCRSHVGPDNRLDLHALCTRWKQAFGTVTVRCYEDIQSRVFDAFLECCQAPDGLRAELAARGIPRINSTHGDLPLALIHQASEQALALGMRASYFNATISPAILTAFKQLRQPPKRRAPFEAAIAERLGALMRSSNQRLADDFGLALGPAYLNPTCDSTPVPEMSFSLTAEDVAGLILASCTDVSVRTAMGMRPAAAATTSDDSTLPHEITALADRLDPWGTADAPPASRLDDLLAAVSTGNHRLYLERQGSAAAAFRQPEGVMEKIADLTPAEWKAIKVGLQRRAHLNLVSWNNVREGEVSAPDHMRLWLRAVPTDGGEIMMLEPIDAAQDQARVDLAQNAGSAAEDAYAFYALASEITQAGDWSDDRLVPLLERAIGLDPELRQAYRLLGTIAERRGDLDGTIRWLHEAAARRTDWAVCFDLGRIHLRQGRPAEAIAHFEQSATLDPARAITLQLLGQAHARQGNLKLALATTERALALNADDPHCQFELGLLKFHCQDCAGARALFERAVTGLPNWAPAAHLLAHTVRQIEGDAAALPLYERAVALDGSNASARYDLGITHYRLGNRSAAIRQLERATTLNPNTPQWGIDLGRAQLEVGDYVSAETWLRQTVAALPASAAATHLLARAVKQQRGGAAALPLYERVVALDGNDAMARYELASIRYELGDYTTAQTHFERAATLSPNWAEAHYYLGLTTCRLQGAAAALPHFTTATAIAPSWAEARYELAVRVLRTGGPRAAQAHFEMVTELAPSWAEPWRQAGACARHMERWPETTRLFKRAFDLGATEKGFLSELADAACRTRQWPIAVDALRRLQPIAANRLAVDKHLGICLRLVGQLAQSETLLSGCIAANPDWPGARFELGITLLGLGRTREARRELERASELQPEWAAPRNVLRDLDDHSNLRLAS